MRLGLVTWSYDNFQGISRCVVELASRLAAQHEVHVLATAVDDTPTRGVAVHRIPLRSQRYYLADWEFFLRAGVLLRRARYDFVHLHFPAWYPAQVFTCHGVARAALRGFRRFRPDLSPEVSLHRMLPYYLQIPLYGYHLRNRRTRITAVSEKARREVVELYGRRPEEVAVIANGVDLERYHPSSVERWREPVRSRLGLQEDQFVLLFVGNHFRHKGGRYALDVLERLPDRVVLVFVGADAPENVPDPKGLLPRLVQSRRVIFTGVDPETWKYYGAADAVLLPSLYESFGLVVLEAMAVGLPVITTRTVALGDEVIRDGENGFVVTWPWEVDALASCIRILLDDPGLARRVGSAARIVAEGFSWDRYVRKTQAVYDETKKTAAYQRTLARCAMRKDP